MKLANAVMSQLENHSRKKKQFSHGWSPLAMRGAFKGVAKAELYTVRH